MSKNINLIVGTGISGTVLARKIAEEANEKVLLIDSKSHIGGNCYDYKDKNGITIHKYGSHIFHTNDKKVWEFFNRFANFNTYMHKVYVIIDGIKTTIPFNLNTLYDVFPKSMAQNFEKKLFANFEYNTKIPILELKNTKDKELNFLANYIYEKVFINYTIKQWGVKPEDIDSSITARVPVFISKDDRYFQDKFQGIPIGGYTQMIEKIINHPNIEIMLSTKYQELKHITFKRIFYTGSIDEFFDYKLGILPYRSVAFKTNELDLSYYQNNSVINYPNNYDFTRIHEYKHYLNENSDKTVIAKEFSTDFQIGENERYYPIIKPENIELYNNYKKLSKNCQNLYFLGRLGDYKYYDMDKAAARAMECFENVFKKIYTSNKED
ncbi:MAG: UDP-galactopyranose mutase [Muribaculaceae bacterium]|nr:UDP-galactopyranose mutase [Muribaculaceae bacterium]